MKAPNPRLGLLASGLSQGALALTALVWVALASSKWSISLLRNSFTSFA